MPGVSSTRGPEAGFTVTPAGLRTLAQELRRAGEGIDAVIARWHGDQAAPTFTDDATTRGWQEAEAVLGRLLADRSRELAHLAAGVRQTARAYAHTESTTAHRLHTPARGDR